MDPISALSLACCVMQVVSFAQETALTGIRIYQSGELDPGLEQKSARLKDLYEDLDSGLKRWIICTGNTATTENDSRLKEVAQNALGTASTLRQELGKIASSKGNAWAAAKGAVAVIFGRKRKIEKLVSKMKGYESFIETRLLMKIW